MIKKYHIVSPRDPSGATWLINCFLNLGIICYRGSKDQVWQKIGDGEYKLTPNEEILKKWLPILSEKEIFHFREDIEVEWSHSWPTEAHEKYKIIYFIRDPRDAIYSRYKRELLPISFSDFLEFPDPGYLLDKIDYWKYFNRLWLTHPELKVFKFESYRKDAIGTLNEILNWIDLDYSDSEVSEAVLASTNEKAAKAEANISQLNGSSRQVNQVMNQGGIVGRWKQDPKVTEAFILDLEKRCKEELELLSYLEASNQGINESYEIKLPMQFKNLNRLSMVRPFCGTPFSYEATTSTVKSVNYCFEKSREWLEQSGLDVQEIKQLSQTTETFLRNDFLSKKANFNISVFQAWWGMLRFRLANKWHKLSQLHQKVGE